MEISVEELIILASIVANKISNELNKEELFLFKGFLMQIVSNLGFVCGMKDFYRNCDKNAGKKDGKMNK